MKVLDLGCSHDHSFEGWFASEDDFQDQLARGMVECPLCGSCEVHKRLSAPRLNLAHGHAAKTSMRSVPANLASAGSGAGQAPAQTLLSSPAADPMQAAWMHMARQILSQTEDVGSQFPEEARRMHYGETPERGIRGQATPEQTQELLEEGIAVMPMVLPAALKETLQ